MTKRTPKPLYSIPQLLKATATRALPVYTEEEKKIREYLIALGLKTALERSRGGRERAPVYKAKVRLILIESLYSGLPSTLKKTPTGTKTIACLSERLKTQFNIHISIDALVRDVKKIGTANLRSL